MTRKNENKKQGRWKKMPSESLRKTHSPFKSKDIWKETREGMSQERNKSSMVMLRTKCEHLTSLY